MSLRDPDSAEYVELMQEINKRFRNKKMLYKYLTEKTVSKPLGLLTNSPCSTSCSLARTTVRSVSSSNCSNT